MMTETNGICCRKRRARYRASEFDAYYRRSIKFRPLREAKVRLERELFGLFLIWRRTHLDSVRAL